MKKGIFIVFLSLFCANFAYASNSQDQSRTNAPRVPTFYGTGLCHTKGFHCVKVKGGQSWKRMFPNERERDLVQRLNRSDTYLYSGRKLVVPDDIKNTTLFDVAPYPLQVKPTGKNFIIVDQHRLAWGAYDKDGKLVKWGPISSGKDYCPDINRSCRTITGVFYVFIKKDKGCRSSVFPVGRGGSRMPFCMFFYKGYALHGSNEVFGRRASHGCVRLFTKDAEWLNKSFVELPNKHGGLGTKVILQKLVTVRKRRNHAKNRSY